jgi:hypothetical protein
MGQGRQARAPSRTVEGGTSAPRVPLRDGSIKPAIGQGCVGNSVKKGLQFHIRSVEIINGPSISPQKPALVSSPQGFQERDPLFQPGTDTSHADVEICLL